MDERTRRLSYYYDLIAKKDGVALDKITLDYLISGLSNEETILLEKKLIDNDSTYKRLETYAAALSPLRVSEEQMVYDLDTERKNAKSIKELSSAVAEYDFTQECIEEINGNTFIYKNGFEIDEFREELFTIGDAEKGNRWYVQLDDEGRLVIY